MHKLDSAVKAAACPRLTISARAAPTPTTTEVTIGVPVRGLTLDRARWKGSACWRAIEYIIREPEVWQARGHTQIAIRTATSMIRPATLPITEVSTYGSPTLARLPSVRLGAAIKALISSRAPPTPDTA